MINELKNSVKNRNELRSKHMAQLEESKANLNEIKSKAAIQLIPSNSVDQEFPPNEDGKSEWDEIRFSLFLLLLIIVFCVYFFFI